MIYCPIAICFPCFCNHIVTGIVTLTARLLSHSQPGYCHTHSPVKVNTYLLLCIHFILFVSSYSKGLTDKGYSPGR